MGFIYGLTVFLVIFEGIKIQCEGAGPGAWGTTFRQRIPNASLNNIKQKIVSISDFETVKWIAYRVKSITKYPLIARILDERLFQIEKEFENGFSENYYLDNTFLNFKHHLILESFLVEAGDQVKKIEIFVFYDENFRIRQNIIKRYAENLEELRIIVYDDDKFWKDILENGISFPKVTKCQIFGWSSRNELKLKSIFPKLENFELIGSANDANCLNNVKNLTELALHSGSIREYQFKYIFENNKNLEKIQLYMPEAETMNSIATYLTKLKTLKLIFPDENFLLKKENGSVHVLQNVKNFDILFYDTGRNFKIENLAFRMPELRKFTLNGVVNDINRIVDLVKQFKKLKILEITVRKSKYADCYLFYEPSKFDSLINIFESFDENFELQTLKFVNFPKPFDQKYEYTMNESNSRLSESGKPTWTLSYGEQIEINERYFMFRRDSLKSSKK